MKLSNRPAFTAPKSKLPLIIGLVLLVILAGGPFVTGMLIESGIRAASTNAAKQMGMQAGMMSYSRGWLSSEATQTLAMPDASLEIELKHTILHGPIALGSIFSGPMSLKPTAAIIRSTLRLKSGTGTDPESASKLANLPVTTFVTQVGLTGSATMHIHTPPIISKANAPAESSYNWSGITGTASFNSNLDYIRLDLKSDSIAIGPAGTGFAIKGMKLSSNGTRGVADYQYGDTTITIDSISTGSEFMLSNLVATTNTKPQGTAIDSTLAYTIKDGKIDGIPFGPANITIVARKIDAVILRQIEEKINEINAKNLPDQQAQMLLMGTMMKYLGQLANKNPEIEATTISIKLGEDTMTGKGKIYIDAQGQDIGANPMLLMMALKANLEIVIPKRMVSLIVMQQIKKDVAFLKRQGQLSPEELADLSPEALERITGHLLPLYLADKNLDRLLVLDGDNYTMRFIYDNNQAILNGEPLIPGTQN